MAIHLLSDQLASQIAAGEVVERPSSVVKELVENAIDAGATTINIDIQNGGRQLVQIADNGSGISADEIETAFLRHATSKLTTVDDLNAIATLGFRGEALAAIAAVSQVTVVSRAAGDNAGTRLTLDGGKVTSHETVGAPQGTVIAVENLFYNVPARLKFLKSITTEKRLIDEFVTHYALAYPHIRFRLSHNGRITFQSNGSGSVLDVLVSVYGPETARQLLEIVGEQEAGGQGGRGEGENFVSPAPPLPLTVSGFVGPPSLHWSNRSHIILFVNGRWIKDNSLTYAVIQAYHTLLPTGRYPLGVIFIQMPPADVDVNVHPTKTEVRFRGKTPFGTVQRAVRETLISDSPIRSMTAWGIGQRDDHNVGWAGSLGFDSFTRRDDASYNDVPDNDEAEQSSLTLDWSQPGEVMARPPMESVPAPHLAGNNLPIMRVVGQVGAAYIITEGPDGLFLIDQHAAHERILYEQFMAAWDDGKLVAQGLMGGTAVHLSPSQATTLEDNLPVLQNLGFQIEPFGPNAFMIRAVPALLLKQDPTQALLDVVEELERGDAPMQGKIEAKIILRVCKTAAVKAGQPLSPAEMEAMIRQLEACHNPHTCPHGRPTLIHLSVAQLARQFGRT
jgi:DNA mismatch repair protein MutL